MGADLCVRDAIVDDADAIAYVHVRTWQTAYRGIVPDAYLDRLNERARSKVWSEMLEEGHDALVGVRGERVVGFADWGPSRDGDGAGAAELYAIYVLASEWGTGIGPVLLAAAVDAMRPSAGEATLWVLADNARARRFYEREGWFADGATKDDDRGDFVLHEVRYRRRL